MKRIGSCWPVGWMRTNDTGGICGYFRIIKDGERGLEGSGAGEAVNGIPMGNSEISYGSED